jgi:hypothetical protein
MTYSSARRRFVSMPASAAITATNANATMRTPAAATHRSVYASDSGRFRTAATAAAPSRAMVVPNASILTSMRRYGASRNPLLLQLKGQMTMQAFSKLPYSTTSPVAARVEAATASESPVQATATQQRRELLFGGLLALTFSAIVVIGSPQTAQAAGCPATAEATSTATSSNSNSSGPPHVKFLPTSKSTNSGNKNKNGGAAASVMLSNLAANNKNNNNNKTQVVPRAVSNSTRAPYDVSVSTTQLLFHPFRCCCCCCCF